MTESSREPGADATTRVDLSDEAVHWDLGTSASYSQYLHLDRLLDGHARASVTRRRWRNLLRRASLLRAVVPRIAGWWVARLME